MAFVQKAAQDVSCGIWDKDRQCRISLDHLLQLKRFHRETIPDAYLDEMGHMNVRWYMSLFDAASWAFFKLLGVDADYVRRFNAGAFALKHVIQYYAEVRAGDTVAVRLRVLGRSDRRFHFMHFMINETSRRAAATLEGLGTHVDLGRRRSSPMPPSIAAAFDARLEADRVLSWPAPVCGIIQV